MTPSTGVNTGCLLVGDYVDKNEVGEQPTGIAVGVAEPTRMIASYVDSWPGDTGSKVFKVLLRDNRVATVRGHSLQYLQNPSNPSDLGSYAILARAGAEEVTVAIFRVSEVTGVFTGGLEAALASA
jgi:hypothetical protein